MTKFDVHQRWFERINFITPKKFMTMSCVVKDA